MSTERMRPHALVVDRDQQVLELLRAGLGGAGSRWTSRLRERICLIARTTPAEWGIIAFSTWSLAKPAAHLLDIGLVTSLSRQHLARILKTGGVSWQTTTTWKSSNDPDFITKMQTVLALYDQCPNGGGVICLDEFGPLNLMPRTGKAWRPVTHPRRLRATYNRDDGVRHMIGALDLATGKIYYIRKRKRWREFLSFLVRMREAAAELDKTLGDWTARD